MNTSDLIEQTYYDPAPSVKESNPSISDELSSLVARCLEKKPEKRFQSVQELLKEFDECPENKPVSVVDPKSAPGPLMDYVDAQVGDRVSFGRYPQGPNGEVEPIIWRVLKRDSDGFPVISEKGLDAKPYNKKLVDITWADCTLRRWLNEEFVSMAFNELEQSLIKTSNLSNNAGPRTCDRIFLLSVGEAVKFFADSKDRRAQSTAYAAVNTSMFDIVFLLARYKGYDWDNGACERISVNRLSSRSHKVFYGTILIIGGLLLWQSGKKKFIRCR